MQSSTPLEQFSLPSTPKAWLSIEIRGHEKECQVNSKATSTDWKLWRIYCLNHNCFMSNCKKKHGKKNVLFTIYYLKLIWQNKSAVQSSEGHTSWDGAESCKTVLRISVRTAKFPLPNPPFKLRNFSDTSCN